MVDARRPEDISDEERASGDSAVTAAPAGEESGGGTDPADWTAAELGRYLRGERPADGRPRGDSYTDPVTGITYVDYWGDGNYEREDYDPSEPYDPSRPRWGRRSGRDHLDGAYSSEIYDDRVADKYTENVPGRADEPGFSRVRSMDDGRPHGRGWYGTPRDEGGASAVWSDRDDMWSLTYDPETGHDWYELAQSKLSPEDRFFDKIGLSDEEKEYLERERQKYHDQLWKNLRDRAPGVDELAWESEEERTKDFYGDLLGDPSVFVDESAEEGAQQRALDEMMGLYESGGWTDADRAMQAANRQMVAQQMGAANQAALQQARARGMTGSGALLAQQGANTQGMANAQMMQDAQMQQAAMQRALSALGAFQEGSNIMREQEQARRSALDDFNRGNLDWRRERETRNTEARSKTNENRANAAQQGWQNRLQATQGITQRAGVSSSPSALGGLIGAGGNFLTGLVS